MLVTLRLASTFHVRSSISDPEGPVTSVRTLPAVAWSVLRWDRNINLLSIGYAFQPRLRPASPFADFRCEGNLELTVCAILRHILVTHAHILTSCRSTTPLGIASLLARTFPYHCADRSRLQFVSSVSDLPPVYFPRRTAGPVSCYAIFKGWLLLSQPPGCLSGSTSFTT